VATSLAVRWPVRWPVSVATSLAVRWPVWARFGGRFGGRFRWPPAWRFGGQFGGRLSVAGSVAGRAIDCMTPTTTTQPQALPGSTRDSTPTSTACRLRANQAVLIVLLAYTVSKNTFKSFPRVERLFMRYFANSVGSGCFPLYNRSGFGDITGMTFTKSLSRELQNEFTRNCNRSWNLVCADRFGKLDAISNLTLRGIRIMLLRLILFIASSLVAMSYGASWMASKIGSPYCPPKKGYKIQNQGPRCRDLPICALAPRK
jgi:hypothetical protein